MDRKTEAAISAAPYRNGNRQGKDSQLIETILRNGGKRARLLAFLADGGQHSVIDIMQQVHIGDPRAMIRTLRNTGVAIADVWEDGEDCKYKRYYIKAYE